MKELLTSRLVGVDRLSFADYQNVPAVNNTLLRAFADSPQTAYEMMHAEPEKPTDAMVIGSAVDLLICDPGRFESEFYLRPPTRPDDPLAPWSGNAKSCREWIATHTDKPVLTIADRIECYRMAEVILDDSRARDLIDQCEPQLSVFWVDKETGLQMKGRPDGKADKFAFDLKVTADAETGALSKTIASMGYHRQAAIYTDGINATGGDCSDFYIIAVQRGDRPKVNVRRLKLRAIETGRAQYKARLRELKACLESNVWPGYSGPGPEIGEIDLPAWAYSSAGMTELKIGGVEYAL